MNETLFYTTAKVFCNPAKNICNTKEEFRKKINKNK